MQSSKITCPICGAVVEKRFSNQRTCQRPECVKAWAARNRHNRRTDYGTRTCMICGKEFAPARYNQKTCSRECREQAKKKYLLEFRIRSGRKKKVKVVTCPICHREFIATHAGAKYCSPECRKAAAKPTSRVIHTLPDMFWPGIDYTPGCRSQYDISYCPLG